MELLSTLTSNPVFSHQPESIEDDKILYLYDKIKNTLENHLLDMKCNDEFLNFMINNVKYINHIYKMLPFSLIIDLHKNHHFLENYITQTQIDEIINHHQRNFMINNYKDKSQYLSLKNKFNDTHNYTQTIYKKRLDLVIPEQLQELYQKNMIYFGSDMINDIGHNSKFKNIKERTISVIWKIYLKNECIIKTCGITRDKFNFIESNNIKFKIYHKISPIEYIMTQELICGDNENIFASPLGFHLIASNTFVQDSQKNQQQDFLKTYENGDYLKIRNSQKVKYPEIEQKRVCYNCKKWHDMNYTFSRYKYMCFDCGIYNYKMEKEIADMTNMTAFITGIRHTIGYSLALKMLRNNCTVIGTSRFPMCALYNYQQESDYDLWKDRLIICQCDFLNIDSVNKTIELVKSYKPHIIINNACQTVRPSRGYYERVIGVETELKKRIICDKQENLGNNQIIKVETDIAHVNQWSKLHNISKVEVGTDFIIPVNSMRNIKDLTLDPINNSWHLQLEQVSMTELLEVNAINQIVPTIIIQQLLEHMSKPAFIIQVSAKEGTFASNKKSEMGMHPHTNMCKAGMNMLIRTLYESKKPGYYFYAVDPGYVSGPNLDDQDYPLSADDGAQRCIYPIISYMKGKPLEQGHWKNYKLRSW
jgi:NAD(P)-dependent dehydrogenase (short-subunit alcohol dehydrogenase family)